MRLWGEFATADAILQAARELKHDTVLSGAYTPFALPELEPLLQLQRPRSIALATFFGAVLGASLSFLLIWWTAAVDYPINVGGRPLNSWPASLPIMFETTVLCASFAAFIGALWTCGMPRLNHPLEGVAGFERTSDDRYWLALDAVGHDAELERRLERLGALRVLTSEERA